MSIIINGDTGVSGVDGSATTPAFQGNDTNTGIFYPAADTIAFAEGGTEVMRIDSSGNVGIGTTTPANKFEVNGDGQRNTARANTTAGEVLIEAQASNYWSTPTYSGTSLRQSGSTATGTYAGLSNASLGSLIFQNGSAGLIATNGGSPIAFATASTERMRIDSGGNVGIGTTSPISRLQVKAEGQSFGDGYILEKSSGTIMYNQVVGSDDALYLGYSSNSGSSFATRMVIDSSGIVTGTAGNLMLVQQSVVTLSSTSTTLTTTIPTWAKRVTLVCNGAIQNSTASLLIRLNSITTGYSSASAVTNTGAAVVSSTAGFVLYGTQSTFGFTGSMTLHNQTGNTWVQSHSGAALTFSPVTGVYGGGSIALAAALSTISVTTTTGTPTLCGSITILYE